MAEELKNETVIKVEELYKQYILGRIGGGTLHGDLQSWWAKVRGKEDPNTKIGAKVHNYNERFYALKGINLEISKGGAVGIIGSNGAGKSTFLKILSRVTAPTQGIIYVKGRISSMLEVGTGFNGELTGRENIYMNGAILGMTKAEIDSKMDSIIAFSECEQFIDTPVKRYSSGMYVKLAFSVAAHLDSEIMIMDEVLAVGDVNFQQKCLGKMKEVSEGEGRTILYVSHNMNTIRQLCNRCIVLSQGEIIFDGDAESAIAEYVKSSQIKATTKKDLSQSKRAGAEGMKVRLQQIELLETKDGYYSGEKPIKMKITLDAVEDFDKIIFHSTVQFADRSPIGTAISSEPICIKKGNGQEILLALHVPMLSEGYYIANFNVFQLNHYGKAVRLDLVHEAFAFSIFPQGGGFGRNPYMGAIDFPPIEIEQL